MRTLRTVKLVEKDGRTRWIVVAPSLRDDDTWDVIDEHPTKSGAQNYVHDVRKRNLRIVREAEK